MRKPVLYKYTKLEYMEDILWHGIYASPLNQLNDPYEWYEVREPERYQVCSLSSSNNAKLMWAHYANGHRGCSIQIEIPYNYGKPECILKPVNYKSSRRSKNNLLPQEIVESLYIKDKKWSHEKEYRAVCDSQIKSLLWKNVDSKTFYKVKIKAVNLGAMANEDEHYVYALSKLREYNENHEEEIKVQRYALKSEKFLISIDKTFNYLKELESLEPKEQKRGGAL